MVTFRGLVLFGVNTILKEIQVVNAEKKWNVMLNIKYNKQVSNSPGGYPFPLMRNTQEFPHRSKSPLTHLTSPSHGWHNPPPLPRQLFSLEILPCHTISLRHSQTNRFFAGLYCHFFRALFCFIVNNKLWDGHGSKWVFQWCIELHQFNLLSQCLASRFPFLSNPHFIEAELYVPAEVQMESAYCFTSEWLTQQTRYPVWWDHPFSSSCPDNEPTTQKSAIHVVAVQGIAVLAPSVLLFAFHGLRDCALSWNTSHSSCGALGTWELCGAVGSGHHRACCHTLLSSFP